MALRDDDNDADDQRYVRLWTNDRSYFILRLHMQLFLARGGEVDFYELGPTRSSRLA
jgi:hypothetical protein